MKCARCEKGYIEPSGYTQSYEGLAIVVWECDKCGTQYKPVPPITRSEFLEQGNPYYATDMGDEAALATALEERDAARGALRLILSRHHNAMLNERTTKDIEAFEAAIVEARAALGEEADNGTETG